jgi:hypothetical protein
MGKKSRSGSGMNIPDHISESLDIIFEGIFMRIRNLDPGSGKGKLGSGIWNMHSGSATLLVAHKTAIGE